MSGGNNAGGFRHPLSLWSPDRRGNHPGRWRFRRRLRWYLLWQCAEPGRVCSQFFRLHDGRPDELLSARRLHFCVGCQFRLFQRPPYANSAAAAVAPGILRLGSDENGASATAFSAAIAEAVLNDRVTLGGGSGSGYWVLPVFVRGMMTASGPAAVGTFQIGLYKNHTFVSV